MSKEEMRTITEELQRRLAGVTEYAGDLQDGSEEWLAFRANGIGASEVAFAMGIGGAFKSAYQFWAEKRGLVEVPEPNERTRERFYWGHASEAMVAQRFAEEHPEFAVENTGTWRHIQRRWQIVNPDRLLLNKETGEIELLEIKTSETGYGWDGGKVPQYYVAQVRDQLSALQLSYGWIAVKIGNSEYREYRIPLDASLPVVNHATGDMQYETEISEEIIIACVEGFLDCVDTGIAPTIDGSVSAWNAVREVNPLRVDESRYVVSEEVADELLMSKLEAETAEARHKRAKSNLLHQVGTAHRIFYTDKHGNEHPLARRDKAGRGNGFTLKILSRK